SRGDKSSNAARTPNCWRETVCTHAFIAPNSANATSRNPRWHKPFPGSSKGVLEAEYFYSGPAPFHLFFSQGPTSRHNPIAFLNRETIMDTFKQNHQNICAPNN